MPPNIDHYRGREQSFIKHLFLQRYLENAAPKLFLGRSTTLNFVDAFAGPWGNTDTESFSDTSFSLAISTLEGVRELLAARYNKDLKVRFRLCERNRASVARLEAFAATKPAVDIKVFSGAFEENLSAIRAACGDIPNSFTITFIDPTGWNVDSRPIFEFLKALKGEVLFNFMAEHVNRHAGWEPVEASFGRFLADPDWRPTFEALPAEWSNEKKILTLLERRMKQAGAARYLPNFAIPKPREERTKMRLMLGTYNRHGVEVFRTVQEEVKKIAIREWHNLKVVDSRQDSMFTVDAFIEAEVQRDGVGCPENMRAATAELDRLVREQPGITFESAVPLVSEQVAVRETHLKDIAVEQRKAGLLHFDLLPRKQKPQPDTKLYPATAEAADDRPPSPL